MRWATDLLENRWKAPILSFRRRSEPKGSDPIIDDLPAAEGDSRRHVRTSVALTSVLHHDSAKVNVTIANLSRGGALIKTPLLPNSGASVLLVRGELCATARVVWASDGSCGLQFAHEIELREWVIPLREVGQRRIDSLVAELKAGRTIGESERTFVPTIDPVSNSKIVDDLGLVLRILQDLKADLSYSPETLSRHSAAVPLLDSGMAMLADRDLPRRSRHQFIDGLGAVFELLSELEDELTSCSETLIRHSYKLQHLDLSMQMLTEISAESLTSDGEQPTNATRLRNLRAACEHALSPH